jgi:hypothetical protein
MVWKYTLALYCEGSVMVDGLGTGFLWQIFGGGCDGFSWVFLTYFLVYLAVSLAKGFGGFSWWMFFVRYPRHLVFADFLGGRFCHESEACGFFGFCWWIFLSGILGGGFSWRMVWQIFFVYIGIFYVFSADFLGRYFLAVFLYRGFG